MDRPVVTGPIEGAAIGNLLMQAVALGELKGIDEVRQVVRNSETVETYEPRHTAAWEDAYGRLLAATPPPGRTPTAACWRCCPEPSHAAAASRKIGKRYWTSAGRRAMMEAARKGGKGDYPS